MLILITLLYFIGIGLSILIMGLVNKRIDLTYRFDVDSAIVLAVIWPIGLPFFLITSIWLMIYTNSDNIRRYLEKHIEGE